MHPGRGARGVLPVRHCGRRSRGSRWTQWVLPGHLSLRDHHVAFGGTRGGVCRGRHRRNSCVLCGARGPLVRGPCGARRPARPTPHGQSPSHTTSHRRSRRPPEPHRKPPSRPRPHGQTPSHGKPAAGRYRPAARAHPLVPCRCARGASVAFSAAGPSHRARTMPPTAKIGDQHAKAHAGSRTGARTHAKGVP